MVGDRVILIDRTRLFFPFATYTSRLLLPGWSGHQYSIPGICQAGGNGAGSIVLRQIGIPRGDSAREILYHRVHSTALLSYHAHHMIHTSQTCTSSDDRMYGEI